MIEVARRVALCALALLLAPSVFAHSKPLTAEMWREDLRVLATELQSRHRNPYHKTSREELEAAVKQLHERIPSLSDRELRLLTPTLESLGLFADDAVRARWEKAVATATDQRALNDARRPARVLTWRIQRLSERPARPACSM